MSLKSLNSFKHTNNSITMNDCMNHINNPFHLERSPRTVPEIFRCGPESLSIDPHIAVWIDLKLLNPIFTSDNCLGSEVLESLIKC